MAPNFSINKSELKNRMKKKGMLSDQIDLCISVFDENDLPIVVSPSFLKFVANGLVIKSYSRDHQRNVDNKLPAETRSFGVYTEDMEYSLPVDSVKISELNMKDPAFKFLSIEMEGISNPYRTREMLTCVLQD